MAKRRMLSIDLLENDRFWMLTPSSQALYFHFILNADDDGFVDKWRSLLRCTGIESKHYRTLKERDYVIELSEDLIVVTDWHRHNTIRRDRYIPTNYGAFLRRLYIGEDGRYYKANSDALVNQCPSENRVDKSIEDKTIEDKSREEQKRKGIPTKKVTNNHTERETREISLPDIPFADTLSDSEKFSYNKFLNAVKLYFMKRYNRTDTAGFIEHYEAGHWRDDKGELIIEKYIEYADMWMQEK